MLSKVTLPILLPNKGANFKFRWRDVLRLDINSRDSYTVIKDRSLLTLGHGTRENCSEG